MKYVLKYAALFFTLAHLLSAQEVVREGVVLISKVDKSPFFQKTFTREYSDKKIINISIGVLKNNLSKVPLKIDKNGSFISEETERIIDLDTDLIWLQSFEIINMSYKLEYDNIKNILQIYIGDGKQAVKIFIKDETKEN